MERTPIKQTDTAPAATKSALKQRPLTDFGVPTPPLKRKVPEGGHDDINDRFSELTNLIKSNQLVLLADSKSNFERNEKNYAELRAEIATQLTQTNERVEEIATTVAGNSSEIGKLQRQFEVMEQEKLSTHMTISGIEPSILNANANDLVKFATELFSSYGCAVNSDVIDQAFAVGISNERPRLIIVFKSVTIKSTVMRMKREKKDPRKIYFDHRMTSATSKLFHHVRHFAKNNGGRVFFYGSRVYFEKEPNQKKLIETVEDLPLPQDHPAQVVNQ